MSDSEKLSYVIPVRESIPYGGGLWLVKPQQYDGVGYVPVRWNPNAYCYTSKEGKTRADVVLLMGGRGTAAEVIQLQFDSTVNTTPPVTMNVQAFLHPDVAPETKPIFAELSVNTYDCCPFSEYGIEGVKLEFVQLIESSIVNPTIAASLFLSKSSPLRNSTVGERQHLCHNGKSWWWHTFGDTRRASDEEIGFFDRISLRGSVTKEGNLWVFGLSLDGNEKIDFRIADRPRQDWFSRMTGVSPQSPWEYHWKVGEDGGEG